MSRSYRKTLLSFVAVALAPLILMGSVLALFIYSNVTEELRKSNAGTLSQIAASGDIILGELDSTFLTLATNSELTFLLADVLKTGTTSYYDALLYRTMKAFLYSQTNSRDYIHSIYISTAASASFPPWTALRRQRPFTTPPGWMGWSSQREVPLRSAAAVFRLPAPRPRRRSFPFTANFRWIPPAARVPSC